MRPPEEIREGLPATDLRLHHPVQIEIRVMVVAEVVLRTLTSRRCECLENLG